MRLVAAVGRDAPGDALAADLAAAGVDCAWLHRHPGPTDAYLAIEGADGALHAAVADCAGLERAGAALLDPLLASPAPGPIVADGNLPAVTLAALLALGRPLAFVPASPEKLAAVAPLLLAAAPTLYLNRAEAEALCGRRFPDTAAAAAAVLARGAAAAIVTDGARPATAAEADGHGHPAPAARGAPQRHRRRRRLRRRAPRRPRRRPRARGRPRLGP